MQIVHAAGGKETPTHMSCRFFIAEHVWVRGHHGRSRLFRDTGGLWGSFALVHQLLHGVCDALITRKSGGLKGKKKW